MTFFFNPFSKYHKTNCSNIAEQIFNFIVKEKKNISDYDIIKNSKADTDLFLIHIYLFSFIITTRNNDININPQKIENITNKLLHLLIDSYFNESDSNINKNSLFKKIKQDTSNMVTLYENNIKYGKSKSITKVINFLVEKFKITNKATNEECFFDISAYSITFFQDFLINISQNYSIAN